MTACPLSIVIPTKNRPLLAAAAVRSALAGLPEGAEVLVVDDGSAAGALAQLSGALADCGAVRLLSNTAPGSAASARNFGVAAARGAWVFFLDDDDLMAPGYAAAVLAALGGQDGGWGFSPVLHHAAGDAPTLPPAAGLRLTALPPPLGKRHLSGLGTGFWIARALFLEAGGLRADLRVNEDTEFCIRLLAMGFPPRVADRAGVSILTRNAGVAGQAVSVTAGTPAGDRARYFGQILDRHGAFLAAHPGLHGWLCKRQLKFLVRAGQFPQARALAGRLGVAGYLRYLAYRLLDRRGA